MNALWKDFAVSYIRKNKAAGISIMVAAFIAALFISAICGMFYNMWADDVQRVIVQEGAWQGKLSGDISQQDIRTIESFSNVKEVTFSRDASGVGTAAILFRNPRSIYRDLPQIAQKLGLDLKENPSAIQYHDTLLSDYLIFAPNGSSPPLLLPFFIAVLLVACLSLVMIIKSAFGVSMNARLHQLGILESVGATPRQVRTVLMDEALVLTALPIVAGTAAGAGLCYGFVRYAVSITAAFGVTGGTQAVFRFPPAVLLTALAACLLTVAISAYMPARRLSRLSPLEAIGSGAQTPVKRARRRRLMSALFGVEGELAERSIRARKKAFRTSSLSLTLSFLAFCVFLSFMTLSDLSTQRTYFERYQNTWDLMVTVKDAQNQKESPLAEIRALPGVASCVAFKTVDARTQIDADMQSDALKAIGGATALSDSEIGEKNGELTVKAPLLILDDESFRQYCADAGIGDAAAKGGQAVAVNTIWDNLHSNRMERKLIPFLSAEKGRALTLSPDSGAGEKQTADITVAAYTDRLPAIREEFDAFTLVLVISESAYAGIAGQLQADEQFFDILTDQTVSLTDMQKSADTVFDGKYDYTLENRETQEAFNVAVRKGYMYIMGGLCGLLALIGIANVFANTLGGIAQRKREFARYLSVGLTPEGAKKVLAIEALVVAGRPVLLGLLLNIPFVLFALRATFIPFSEFACAMPFLAVAVFAVLIFAFVGLFTLIGGKRTLGGNLIDALKDDTLY